MEEEQLEESRFKKVIRKGKVVKKLKCRPGYKAVNGRCVKMAASELRSRGRAAKKAARHRKGKKSQMKRARKISMKIRKSKNL